MKFLIIIIFCLMTGIMAADGDAGTTVQEDQKPRAAQEVIIASNAVKVPLGSLLLARKGSQYCAVKFTEVWYGETEEDFFTNYGSYCQADRNGNFSNKNVQFMRGQLAKRRLIFFDDRFISNRSSK